jgi:hypothetical protein
MRISIKIALLLSGIWFLGKYLLFYFQLLQSTEGYTYHVMWNILCLLFAMTIGSWIEKRRSTNTDSNILSDLKTILSPGLVYALMVSGMIYFYYAKIDPAYNQQQIALVENSMKEMVNNPEALKKFKQERPEFEAFSKEEILKKSRESIAPWYTPKTSMIIALLGMLMLSILNGLILTIIYRKVLFVRR